MMVGVPLAVVFLPIEWLLLTRWLYPPGPLRGDAREVLAVERRALGPMSRYVTVPQMARAGLWFNLVATVLLTAAASYLVPLVFG